MAGPGRGALWVHKKCAGSSSAAVYTRVLRAAPVEAMQGPVAHLGANAGDLGLLVPHHAVAAHEARSKPDHGVGRGLGAVGAGRGARCRGGAKEGGK